MLVCKLLEIDSLMKILMIGHQHLNQLVIWVLHGKGYPVYCHGKSKAASTLITAIGKGFIVVISKATSDQYYTAEQGLRDFIWAIGESVLSQIVGEKLAGKIPEAISGLVRLVGNSSGTVAK